MRATYLEPIIFLDVSSSFSLSWLLSGVEFDAVAAVKIAAMMMIIALMIYLDSETIREMNIISKLKCNYCEIQGT